MKRNTIEEDIPVPAEILSQAIPLQIPIRYLHGIKNPPEYQGYKKRNVREAYATKGIQVLHESPVYTTFIPVTNGGMITIFNGHHRTRYAPEYNIRTIPTLVFPVEAVAAFMLRPVDEILENLIRWSGESIESFSRSFARQQKEYIGPQAIIGVANLEELAQQAENNFLGITTFAFIKSALG